MAPTCLTAGRARRVDRDPPGSSVKRPIRARQWKNPCTEPGKSPTLIPVCCSGLGARGSGLGHGAGADDTATAAGCRRQDSLESPYRGRVPGGAATGRGVARRRQARGAAARRPRGRAGRGRSRPARPATRPRASGTDPGPGSRRARGTGTAPARSPRSRHRKRRRRRTGPPAGRARTLVRQTTPCRRLSPLCSGPFVHPQTASPIPDSAESGRMRVRRIVDAPWPNDDGGEPGPWSRPGDRLASTRRAQAGTAACAGQARVGSAGIATATAPARTRHAGPARAWRRFTFVTRWCHIGASRTAWATEHRISPDTAAGRPSGPADE